VALEQLRPPDPYPVPDHDQLLGSFDCKYKYSAHSCDACRDAYRYWVCGMAFPECGPNDAYVALQLLVQACAFVLTECVERCRATFCTPGVACDPATSAKRLCLSLCEDVVRKCPYTLAFTCPTVGFPSWGNLPLDK